MKRFAVIALTIMISGIDTSCYALRCNCDDWVEKGGYCVDYIKTRIPAFQIPTKDEMADLKNASIKDVTSGDVAVFSMDNYWHVAYVEDVHRDPLGKATAIDVSEMNFGGELKFGEFKEKWKSGSEAEWNRAMCCGITENYGLISQRKNIALDTVKQIWSPDDAAADGAGRRRAQALVDRVREVINRFFEFTESEL